MPQARVYQCPNCREFIATDATSCRFCSAPVDPQTAQAVADAQEVENRTYRKKQYARHMLIGGGVFVLGFVITIGTYLAAAYSEGGESYVMMYGLLIIGAGDFLYGLVGWLGELKKQ